MPARAAAPRREPRAAAKGVQHARWLREWRCAGGSCAASRVSVLDSGRSRYWIADFVWKWAPQGNPKQRNFVFQTEYLKRSENGELECEGGLCPPGITDSYRARQSGWYAQGVFQFMPRWRIGYRYDRLNVGTVDFGASLDAVLSKPDHKPNRHSLMLDYSPSEFSRLRLQLARDRGEQGLTDNQVTLQYIYSLGPHGAHKF